MKTLHERLPQQPFVLAGWSYGGTLACAYTALHPTQVNSLVTMAATPCFVQRSDWPEGMHQKVFSKFLADFQSQPKKTLEQFMLLCIMSCRNKKTIMNALTNTFFNERDDVCNLLFILKSMGTTDIRHLIGDIQCPTVHFYAQKDALVSAATAAAMARDYHHHHIHIISSGHSFIIECAESIAEQLSSFCLQGGGENQ
ncbi:MAG: alpha/beta fold hydrolase [Candidatus Endonucleobacter bathymodioli]|uniref:Alpha/beta fold hydrolase n=1 Tax=Candidatus Endonucleibacter bathymodioli TaxID=539814 RepID=A0AA90SDI5_9GAMM|nr:alpha/beta fold hydrolase [Candidatus Endonucleobacter bathymodioli]